MSLDPALRARLHGLLAEYGAKVRRLIESHGLGQYGIDPADIEQEVRIRLWKALERDRNAAFHTSYIQRVVLSTVIDAIRAANSRPAEPLPDETEESGTVLIEHRAGPERSAGGAQDFGRVAACLAELPERTTRGGNPAFAGVYATRDRPVQRHLGRSSTQVARTRNAVLARAAGGARIWRIQ